MASVPMAGGELGFHYDPDGTLYAVAGAYFEDVAFTSALAFTSIEQARGAAHDALEGLLGINLDGQTQNRPDLLEQTSVFLASEGDGRSFAFVWEAPFNTAEGSAITVALHGGTGDVIASWDPNPTGLCEPSTQNAENARAIPQNPDIGERTLVSSATTTSDRPGYTHEARPPGALDVWVYMGWNTPVCPGTSYAILPLKEDAYGMPIYQDPPPKIGGGLSVPSQAGGDAMLKTQQTMAYFASHEAPWMGWNGQSAVSKIVTKAMAGCPMGQAVFVRTGTSYAPAGSVAICYKGTRCFLNSAALDVVAHEWGHGVVYATTGWWTEDPDEAALHEGWADVVAFSVEFAIEPEGTLAENADWGFAEDNPVDDDPEPGCPPVPGDPDRTVVTEDGGPYIGFSYHADDYPDPAYPHYGGFPLPVALYLSAEGVENPVCNQDGFRPHLPACALDPENPFKPTAIGDDKAGRIFFRTLTQYVTSTHTWEDFSDLAKQAAHDLYWSFQNNYCYDATVEQQSVMDAFTAIGYPGSQDLVCICLEDCGEGDPD